MSEGKGWAANIRGINYLKKQDNEIGKTEIDSGIPQDSEVLNNIAKAFGILPEKLGMILEDLEGEELEKKIEEMVKGGAMTLGPSVDIDSLKNLMSQEDRQILEQIGGLATEEKILDNAT